MKIYIWSGQGLYLSAAVIVAAESKKDARELIEKELIDNGIGDSWKGLHQVEEIEINDSKIIFTYNGDY